MARIPLQIASRGLETGPMVNYSGVSRSPVGQALQSFGGEVQGLSSQLSAIEERRRQQEEDAQNFEATQKFNQFRIQAEGDVAEIAQSVPASAMGFHAGAMEAFQKREAEFMANVPERLRPRFQSLLETERLQFSQNQAQAELTQRQSWYRTGIEQDLSASQGTVYNDPTKLEMEKQKAFAAIDASGLPEAEREEWRLKVDQGLAASIATRLLEENPEALTQSLGVAITQPMNQNLVGAMIRTESSGNPNAESPVGASGLMQVMPATGVEVAGELNDPNFPVGGTLDQQKAYLKREDVSLRYGTHYMNKMLNRYGGDIEAALIAYNGGPARADAWLRANRDDSAIPKESANYYKKVLNGLPSGALMMQPNAGATHVQVAKAFLGASEGRDGGAISAFIKKSTGVKLDPTQTAWCAAWLNAVFQSQGIQGTGKLNARSFLDFGEEVKTPSVGDVVVFSRGDPSGWQGHVGLFAGFDSNGNIKVLGGNQGGRVSVQSYSKDRLLGYRRPPSVGNAADARERLDRLPGGGPTEGMVITDLDPRFASLPFPERLKLASQARQQQQQRLQAEKTQRDAEYKAYNNAVELDILTGKIASEQDILSDPLLNDGDKASRLRTFRSQRKEATETDLAVQDYLAGGMGDLNPLDTGQRSTANKVYEVLNKNLAGASEEDRRAVTDEFVQRTSIIPDPVAANLRRGQFSANPQEFAAAMDEAGRINSIAPIAFETMSGGEQLRRDLTSYQHMVNNRGMSAEEASKRILERRSEDAQRNETILGPQADKLVKDLDTSDVTREFATGFFGFGRPDAGVDPTTQNALLAEYREAFREEFIRAGGDEDEAKAQAVGLLKKTWGESSLTGDRQLMKYPPERFYPQVGGGHTYLADDMRATAEELALADDSVEALGRVWLRPSPATAADIRAGRPPRYRMFYEYSRDGQLIVDEAPGFWGMPPERIDESRAATRQQSLQDAEATRDFLSDRQEVPADQRMNFIEQEERINESIRSGVNPNQPAPELTPMREAPPSQRQLGSIGSAADARSTTNQMLEDFRGTR